MTPSLHKSLRYITWYITDVSRNFWAICFLNSFDQCWAQNNCALWGCICVNTFLLSIVTMGLYLFQYRLFVECCYYAVSLLVESYCELSLWDSLWLYTVILSTATMRLCLSWYSLTVNCFYDKVSVAIQPYYKCLLVFCICIDEVRLSNVSILLYLCQSSLTSGCGHRVTVALH